RLDAQRRTGRIRIRYRSVPHEITPKGVLLSEVNGRSSIEPADTVFLLTGYGPDYRLLRALGVRFHKQTGRPLFAEATLETRRPGVFVCGTVALKLNGEAVTIENSRDHALQMLDSIRARRNSLA
ncbi:MAG: NAD(P)-binding domain-containing protein, partial [Alkalispirochaeta sp.]